MLQFYKSVFIYIGIKVVLNKNCILKFSGLIFNFN